MEGLGEVHDLCTEGSHAGAAANPHCFFLAGGVDVEVAVGAGHYHLVAGFEREDIGGGYTGHHVLEADFGLGLEWRGGYAHGEHDAVAFGRVVGHGVGAHCCLLVLAFEAEEAEFLPCGEVFLADERFVDVLVVVHLVGRNLDLGVGSGLEVHVFARRKGHDEFLDECGHILVGDNLTFPFAHVEHGGGHADAHVGFYLYLAAQTPMILHLLAGEMDGFGGEDFAAAFEYLHFALAARAFAAACARQEDVFVGERGEDGGAGLCLLYNIHNE